MMGEKNIFKGDIQKPLPHVLQLLLQTSYQSAWLLPKDIKPTLKKTAIFISSSISLQGGEE